jgi:hypothetical protein
MMGTLSFSFVVSPQMEPKCRFWFGKLSTECWERPLLANMGKYGEKQLVDDINNVRLECWMR